MSEQEVYVLIIKDGAEIVVEVCSSKHDAESTVWDYVVEHWDPEWIDIDHPNFTHFMQNVEYFMENTDNEYCIVKRHVDVDSKTYVF